MLERCIKYFFMIICSTYISSKVLNHPISSKNKLFSVIASICFQIPLLFLRMHANVWSIPITILFLTTLVFFIAKVPMITAFITAVISYAMAHFAFFFPSIIITPFFLIIVDLGFNREIAQTLSFIPLGLLQLLFSSIPFRFNRLKKGMPFILEKKYNGIGFALSILILYLSTLLALHEKNKNALVIALNSIAILGIFLIIWWLRQITRSYLQKIREREINELKTELEQIKEENQRLAKIIHKDNKLIPAMEMAVRELLEATPTQEEVRNLLSELERLSSERKGILNEQESSTELLNPTGFVRLDAQLRYMKQRASNHNINLLFTYQGNIKYLAKHIIPEEQLSTVVSDLLENAIIATKEEAIRNILLTITVEEKHYRIAVYDSGDVFSPEVIQNLGQTPTTTHKDAGGSGIGLMTITEILSMTKGSLTIEEFKDNSQYTKCISLDFDGLNQYTMKSYRSEILTLQTTRKDIHFILI